ncbi:substrate-binding periplasmic protein [Neptuniibacter sp. QD72_48]|uniref:substrate-binding periplasmic protein n=1 Tax=Neptuniibacter sp. QD72_48 TaxID=3398214 RepID=UPI0039F53774
MKLLSPIFVIFAITANYAAGSQLEVNLTAGEYPPYQSQKLKHYGVVSRIVSEAFALEGVQVNFTFMPWKRAYPSILEGKLDGVGYATKKKEREKYFYFSEPIFQKTRVFFHHIDHSFDWNTIEDLKGLQIGALSGYAYNDEFDLAAKQRIIIVQRVETHQQNIGKLVLGNRIDLAISTINQGYDVLQRAYPQAKKFITYHPKPLHSPNMHLMLSRKVEKNKELIVLFNRGLKKLKESGKLEQYFKESQQGEYLP